MNEPRLRSREEKTLPVGDAELEQSLELFLSLDPFRDDVCLDFFGK